MKQMDIVGGDATKDRSDMRGVVRQGLEDTEREIERENKRE